jgi:hypothetical protein
MKTSEKWIVDLDEMKCRNSENGCVVKFECNGNYPLGKLELLPGEFFEAWLDDPNKYWQSIDDIAEASEIFVNTYIENNGNNA